MASVNVERTDDGFVARNARGAAVQIGSSDTEGVFTPVELLLAAVGGCNIVTVEPLTAKRGHRMARLQMTVQADKAATNSLGPVTITYEVELPEGDEKAEEVFRNVAARVHANYCTVSNTLQKGVPVHLAFED